MRRLRARFEADHRDTFRFTAVILLCGISCAGLAADTLPPEDLEALPYGSGQILLTWTDVTNDEDGFVLERATDTGPWTQVADINDFPAGSSEYIDNVGGVREEYAYRVASSHTGVLSPWSDISTSLPVLTDMPLHGWLDVTDYSTCTIAGVSDPHPIQCALEDLGGRIGPGEPTSTGPHVLFFPDGEYLIDQTLFLEGRGGVQFVGQSPGGVVLKWTGGPGSGPDDTKVMFHAEGNRDSTWRNIVWDGNCVDPDNCFVVAFDQSFCGRTDTRVLRSGDCGPANLGWPESETIGESDIGAAHVDSVFKNAFVGLRLGHYGVADDTSTIRRCQFLDNFVGVSLEDFNALNHTFWDSLFQDNFVGIANDIAGVRKEYDPAFSPGVCEGQAGDPACFYGSDCDTGISCVWTRRRAGDFDIYRGRFVDNSHTDVWADPTGEFIVRDSWATGSDRFFFGAGLNGTPGRYTLLNNTVWDDQGLAIETRTPGTFLFADNEIYTDPDAKDAPVVLDSLVGFDHPDSGSIDLIAVDNVYSRADPYDFKKVFRLRQFGDQTTSTPPPVSIPPLPAVQESLNGRPIYTVTDATTSDATANAVRIQQIIDAALADPQPAIVHLPGIDGRYQIDRTLNIPAAADLILTGDGKYTTLWWVGTPGEPILEIDGAQVDGLTIRDLNFLYGGIRVENLSQDNAHALLTQLRVAQSSAAGVVIADLDTVKLNFVSYAGEHGLIVGPDAVGMLVKAGTEAIPAQDKPGVAVWSGTTLKHLWDYLVVNDQAGAKVLISGNYMEVSEHHLRVQGDGADGTVALHGSKMAPVVLLDDPDDPVEMAEKTATVSVEDYAGNLSLVESTMFIVLSGYLPSSPEAADYGARVRVVGSQTVDVDVQALGNTLRRQPSVIDPNDPTLDEPEYDLFDAQPNTVDFLRLSGKRAIASALPLPDIHADEIDPQNPVPVGTLTPEQESQLFAGLELLRTMQLPQFYDEPGASDPQQINFDRVFIFKASPVGLLLSGGVSCFVSGDCADVVACTVDSCDLAGLPANVPGQCRFAPSDALCDDGDACTANSCDPLTGCSNDPITCDDSDLCNGIETCDSLIGCQAGTPLGCDDADACTADSCDPLVGCLNDPITCDDGLFCNGVETCDPLGGCQLGTPLDCDDSVACTADSCNETTDTCDHLPDDGFCDNGLFCDGIETCDVLADCAAGNDSCPGQSCSETTEECSSLPGMEVGAVSVGGTRVTVPLSNTYFSPVVVCSVQYSNNTTPVVARVSNVTSTSFDVRLQNPSDGAVADENVSYIVVEEGAWNFDGVNVEAQIYTSTVTDENDSWVGEIQGYSQGYNNPVVVGQVMTENDPDWSVFWCSKNDRKKPPTSSELRTGKTVCEDSDVTRLDETIGFIVVEAGSGTIGGVAFEAAVGNDSIRGVSNSPPYIYGFDNPFSEVPTVVVTAMAGVGNSNGGWSQSHGPTLATTNSLFLSIDEDQVRDSERSHGTERVGYLAFGNAFAVQSCASQADCDDGVFCNGVEDCVSGACQAGSTVDCDDGVGCTVDACNVTTDSCDNTPDDGACDNGLFCDGVESCDAINDCQTGDAVDCADGVGCTTDICNEDTDGCDHVPVDASCDNGLFCDGAETCDIVNDCQAASEPCSGQFCDESNDVCVACEGDADCDDGAFCNGAEICSAGDCKAGAPRDIDDGVSCTIDACDEVEDSIIHTPDDGACDNGLFCDGIETCDAAQDCQPGTAPTIADGVGCTDDSCDEANDLIVNTPNDGNCDNGQFCDGAETCDAVNDCQAATAVVCNDGVGCTSDSCNEETDSCDNTPDDGVCDNGQFCDGAETCDAVNDCQAGTPPGVDDGVSCTTDACDEATDSITHTPDDGACDNTLFCDGAETCDAVNDCQAGVPPDDDDGVSCTIDACDEATDSITHTPDDGICDNTLFCDGAETCDAVNDCQTGTAPAVDDGVSCTTDACDEATDSITHTLDDGVCDNGQFCDGAETCDAVNDCQAGTPPGVDDGVSCTIDACDEATDSITHTPDDGICDNTLFCDGAETCDAVNDCQAGSDPCPGESCDEASDLCVACFVDNDCDDGSFCNGAETCNTGNCQAGTPPDIDDGVACTVDACDEATDSITHTPDDGVCDNGQFCDGAETCDAVNDCQAATAVVCNDGVGCTSDSCNEETDSCDNTPDDGVCDNGQFCDGAETCDAVNDCQAGTPPGVDDGVSCTTDACDEATDSITHTPDDGACDNTLFCDGAETCDAVNDCQAGVPPDDDDGVSCTIDACDEATDSITHTPDDGICDNTLFCDGAETCDAVNDCQTGTAPAVDDGVSCTTDACDEATDSITHTLDDGVCDNGQFCDGAETCDAVNDCQAGTPPGVDDGVSCTIDACDEATDSITHTPDDGICDNTLFCDGAETCDAVNDCQAGSDPCPGESCDEASDLCVACFADNDCDDGSFCNGAETCNAGNCQAGTPPDIDDGVACTVDACDEATDSIIHTPDDGVCDNGQFCDGAETCDAVNDCQAATAVVCNDGVGCTSDSCNEETDSCDNTPDDGVCDNGQFCDGAETCDAVNDCQAGTPPGVDDGVSCTTDACDEATDSITHTPDDGACDNTLFCDGAETCDAVNDCQAGVPPDDDDGVSCTIDACDEATDSITHTPDDGICDNTLFCDGAETCDAVNDCQTGTAPAVDDGVSCTTDACDEATDSITHTLDDGVCDNGQFCDGAETCDAVNDCQAGTAVDCSDGVGCTTDSCNEGTDSCDNTATDELCDNGFFCDGAETCDAVNDCQAGSDPCPLESCDEAGDQCVACLVDNDCDDGNFCNGAETCNAGNCQAGTAPSVDDGVACTIDACDEETDSITHAPDDGACDSGFFCDGIEICDAVNDCQAGTAVNCNDGVDCTTDSCNEGTDSCDNTATDELCDNGFFCDGAETCDKISDCQSGLAVECNDGVGCTLDTCNEGTDSCDNTPVDAACDDGAFCNGVETCDPVLDCRSGNDPCPGQTCDEVGNTCDASPMPRMETGVIAAGNTFVTVPLVHTYVSPVVVCSVQYDANVVPVVARVRNVTSTGFEVRLQDPSSGTAAAENINYLVVEEGVWTIDGLNIEAWTYTSTVTDENASWVGEEKAYGQSYANPVVLGQVMSENDADWSAFWSRGNSATAPPSSTTLWTGKMVGEDPDVTRANETIGVIVLEAGTGTIGSIAYEAALGADTVRGAVQNPPHTYTFASGFASPPAVAVVTMAGMDGNNGGWAQTHGTPQADGTTLYLSVDEDQVGDSERSHTTEQVGYAVFEAAFAFPEVSGCVVPADCDDGLYCNGIEDCVAGTCQAGTPIACGDGIDCTADACNEATDSCDSTPVDGACDNGVFCDGAEICDPLADCQTGVPVDCQDSVACTSDSCNEATDSCEHAPNDGACDNGIFCDGVEICDPLTDCQPGPPACDDGVGCTTDACNEASDSCDNTPVDAACDNDVFCDGTETCDPVADCQAGTDPCPGQACNETEDVCESGPAARLETGARIVGGTPVTVFLANSYVSPVVVCSVQYENNTVPVVARVSNVTSNSFDVRLQNPSNGNVAAENVSYIVVEEGVWTFDGVAIEAQVYNSTITDENNSWIGEVQTYGRSYTSPVVLGQIMTENDLNWSVFWCQGSSRANPPSTSSLRTGKTVCEDSDTARSNETVGFIVIEAGGGTIGGVAFEAALGADSVGGVDDSSPYGYTFNNTFASPPTVAITTMAGVDGGNGGWSQSHGPNLSTTTSLFLSIDEDQVGDPERNHTLEQVGYLVFEAAAVYP